MIQIAIVEDEQACAKQLEQYLERYAMESKQQFQITIFHDGDEIVENYRGQFDIILMDIEMEFMDGMTTAQEIRKTDHKVIIIFITNMAQYAIQGYEVEALDYVLKPVSYFAFTQRLGRAITRMNKRETKYITINAKTRVAKVPVSEIYWIESQGHRLTYHTGGKDYESTVNSMKEVETLLKEEHFFRCNKCYMVNLVHVKGIEDGCAIVNENRIQISRAKKSEFQKALTDFTEIMIK